MPPTIKLTFNKDCEKNPDNPAFTYVSLWCRLYNLQKEKTFSGQHAGTKYKPAKEKINYIPAY